MCALWELRGAEKSPAEAEGWAAHHAAVRGSVSGAVENGGRRKWGGQEAGPILVTIPDLIPKARVTGTRSTGIWSFPNSQAQVIGAPHPTHRLWKRPSWPRI